jgi:hypothetical protein
MARRNRIELLARLGYAAHGTVNLIVGLLALLAALGRGGGTTGSRGALQALLAQPAGQVLLGVVALGLVGFALWRACQAVLDADGRGRSGRALLARTGQGVSAVIYAGLALSAVGLLMGWRSAGNEEQSAEDWTAWLMLQPFGRWLLALVGLAVIGAAAGMAAKAWTASFRDHLTCDARTASWAVPLGRIGHAARAVVTLTIGIFLVIAAWQFDPGEARGLGGALAALQDQPFGRALFALVAAGLAAFGAFEFVEARHRRIRAPAEVAALVPARMTAR